MSIQESSLSLRVFESEFESESEFEFDSESELGLGSGSGSRSGLVQESDSRGGPARALVSSGGGEGVREGARRGP